MSREFEGKVVVVTGGAQGIGRAIAAIFHRHGARVALADIQEESTTRTATELGERAVAIASDVADRASAERAIDKVMYLWGQIDVLVNNAGVQLNRPSLELVPDDLRRVLDTNLLGAFHFARAAADRSMVARRTGSILNISSVASILSFPRRLPYGMSKAALNAMTRILAAEWAEHGIRVNAIAPGYIRTQLVEDAARWGHVDLEEIADKTPAGRLGSVEDIAEAALFLASERAQFITGQIMAIDGGFTLSK